VWLTGVVRPARVTSSDTPATATTTATSMSTTLDWGGVPDLLTTFLDAF
jgi:hypothetical protein